MNDINPEFVLNADEMCVEIGDLVKMACTGQRDVFRHENHGMRGMAVRICVNCRGKGPGPLIVALAHVRCRR
jgi:hypothetical protein